MQKKNTDVLIVGAGPTGLTLATAFAERGIQATIIDRLEAGANTSRAAVVHSRTLEVLESIGVSDRLVRQGLQAPRFTIRDRDRVLVNIDFSNLPTQYPYTLMISQAVTESILLARFTELNGKVLRSREVTDIEQNDKEVITTLSDGTRLSSRYLVGCDGMHSTVREHAGIGFPGDSYGESFSLADARLTGNVPSDEVILYFSPAGLVVVAPLPGGIHRIVSTIEPAPEHPDIAFVQGLLDERGPERSKIIVKEVIWGSRFRIHHRVADTYYSGRVLLAGDAAHVHSPAGGQGMNTGIQDAMVLSKALATVLTNGNDELLNTYSTTRRPIAKQVVRLADRLTRLATIDRRMRPLRNSVLSLLDCLPPFRRNLAWRLSGLINR